MQKQKVLLLFGGTGEEYAISLLSAAHVMAHLDNHLFEIFAVGIRPDGKWFYYDGQVNRIAENTWMYDDAHLFLVYPIYGGVYLVDEAKVISPDVVFPLLHGDRGEDGRLAGLLDCLGLPFVGCGALASALSMHKHHTKLQFTYLDIPTAKWLCLKKEDTLSPLGLLAHIRAHIGDFPLFVKPSTGGSSVGASIVSTPEGLDAALSHAFLYSDEVMIEEYIRGLECEIGVFCDRQGMVISRPGLISTTHDFYDYQAKYIAGDTTLTIPAPLPPAITERMQEYARRAFLGLHCRGLSRFDFFYDQKGRVLLSEVNTMPGMTKHSLYPLLLEDSGIPFSVLLTKLLLGAVS